MTALAVWTDEDTVVWGSDSQDYVIDRKVMGGQKYQQVFRDDAALIVIGCAGDARPYEAALHRVNWAEIGRAKSQWNSRYYQTRLLDALNEAMQEALCAGLEDGYVVMSLNEHILVYDDHSLYEVPDDRFAVGSGSHFVLGALYGAGVHDRWAMDNAIYAAVEYDLNSGGEVHVSEWSINGGE